MQKGGFVIVDDFKVEGDFGFGGGGWEQFEENMKRVLPDARFYDMDAVAPDLPLVFRDQHARHLSAGVQRRPAGLPRPLRGQRSAEAAA